MQYKVKWMAFLAYYLLTDAGWYVRTLVVCADTGIYVY
jgi:hypothetical protein